MSRNKIAAVMFTHREKIWVEEAFFFFKHFFLKWVLAEGLDIYLSEPHEIITV